METKTNGDVIHLVYGMSIRNDLMQHSMKMWSFHNSLFSFYNDGKVEGIICIYVDDFLWACTNEFEKSIIDKLRNM